MLLPYSAHVKDFFPVMNRNYSPCQASYPHNGLCLQTRTINIFRQTTCSRRNVGLKLCWRTFFKYRNVISHSWHSTGFQLLVLWVQYYILQPPTSAWTCNLSYIMALARFVSISSLRSRVSLEHGFAALVFHIVALVAVGVHYLILGYLTPQSTS